MLAMVTAFENPKIFDLISGQATKALKIVQCGAKLRKKDGYVMVGDVVNQLCNPPPKWSAKQCALYQKI